jgi:hypothetical protein
VSSEQETIINIFKMEIQKLRNEKLKIENENKQLHIAIKLKMKRSNYILPSN